MKRKMIGAAAAYMSGLFFASFFSEGSGFLLIAGLFPLFCFTTLKLKAKISDIIMMICCFVAAFMAYQLHTHFVYDKIIAFGNSEVSFCGEITDIDYSANGKASYTIDGSINGDVNAEITFFGDDLKAEIGDTIAMQRCFVEIPENDYLFRRRDYLRSKGIYLNSYQCESFEITHTETHWLERKINAYRDKIISDFNIKLGEVDGAFLSGIVFGENPLWMIPKKHLCTDAESDILWLFQVFTYLLWRH